MSTTDGQLDEGLERLKAYGPEFAGFLSNHGPMVIETLATNDQSSAIEGWLGRYVQRLEDRPQPYEPISEAGWQRALGEAHRFSDWADYFRRRLDEEPWQQTLAVWIPRLAPGFSGSATHGVLRTAHAMRAIAATETQPRSQELADALAYWAASYQKLPESGTTSSQLAIPVAIQQLPILSPEDQAKRGWEERVAGLESFAPVINTADLAGSASAVISEIAANFAHLYLANAEQPNRVIIPLHAVTSSSALRLLLPFVSNETARTLLRYAWQTAAAIATAYATRREFISAVPAAGDWQELAEQALAGGDEHAIKLTEACRREYAISGHPVFFAAAADASRRLGSG